jgi:hypothetical protein
VSPVLQTVTNRDTERANRAIRAISKIAESASYVFSIPGESSTPPASTNSIFGFNDYRNQFDGTAVLTKRACAFESTLHFSP